MLQTPFKWKTLPSEVPFPAKSEFLNIYLERYDRDLANFLISDLTIGFHLIFLSIPSSILLKNNGSTIKHPEIVLNKIKKKQSYEKIF